jgi:hypothetical protein
VEDKTLKQYIKVVQHARTIYLATPTKSGRPSKGPRAFYINRCEQEGELGISHSGKTAGERWACKTCKAFMVNEWSDGIPPDEEEARDEWAAWMAKGKYEIVTM